MTARSSEPETITSLATDLRVSGHPCDRSDGYRAVAARDSGRASRVVIGESAYSRRRLVRRCDGGRRRRGRGDRFGRATVCGAPRTGPPRPGPRRAPARSSPMRPVLACRLRCGSCGQPASGSRRSALHHPQAHQLWSWHSPSPRISADPELDAPPRCPERRFARPCG
jgi:hypothetical protein